MTIRTANSSPSPCGVQPCASAHQRPVLNRLIASRRGNVLPILAASILPMAAMIGGAIDMSRAYMVKSRIQQACDAGVLAGRRAMQQSSYSAAAKTQAQNFFNINFKAGYNDSTDVVFTTSNPAGSSKVVGQASTVMPTAVMGMFGRETIDVDVECEAELNLSNSDVTFVLDVTGSMGESIPTGSNGSIVKITALRNSVMSFYDTLANAAAGGNARIRYAFVPYSTNVNVGELLYDADPTWLTGGQVADTWKYQSRRPLWNITSTANQTLVDTEQNGTSLSATGCLNYGNTAATTVTSGNTTTRTSYRPWRWGGAAQPWSGFFWTLRTCVRERTREITTTTVTETANWQAGATFSRWEYGQWPFRVDAFVRSIKAANPAVPTPSETNGSTSRWNGCIEERDTVPGGDIVFGSNGITVDGRTDAHDLKIDGPANSAATRWRPYWEDVYFFRDDGTSLKNYGGGYTACPSKASLLATMQRNQVQSYVNGLVTVGGTYHDVGLLWGARIASPQGIFAANVNASPGNGGSISRHLIFMTDGQLTSYDYVASMYGLEMYDKRVTGGNTDPSQLERQRRRYLAICEAIKSKGIRLWVIAFGTTLTADLETCASTGSSFTAENSAKLNTAFQNIAKQISELRLTK